MSFEEKQQPSSFIPQNGGGLPGGMSTTPFFAPSPVQAPAPGPGTAVLPGFTTDHFVNGNLPNFDVQYDVKGPVPETGTLWVSHNVFYIFPATMTKIEREQFHTDFAANIHSIWSNKHLLTLSDPGFAAYQCNVEVLINQVAKQTDAHTVIQVNKKAADSERFRSNVTPVTKVSGSETTHVAKLDARDAGTPDKTGSTNFVEKAWQVGDFDFDSTALNGAVLADISEVEDTIRPFVNKDNTDPNFLEDPHGLLLTGRASKQGNADYNKQLGQDRADGVANKLKADLGQPAKFIQADSAGAENATNEDKFRRVDVLLMNSDTLNNNTEQNTGAHEFGHMIGLGDEYAEEKSKDGTPITPKFMGDKPSHYDDVKNIVGQDAADELIIRNTDSIMARGESVERGHYVYFADALNKMTSKSWKVQ